MLNVDGYYNSLLSFIDKAVEEGFISPDARHIIVSAPTPKELVNKLEVICLPGKTSHNAIYVLYTYCVKFNIVASNLLYTYVVDNRRHVKSAIICSNYIALYYEPCLCAIVWYIRYLITFILL